MTENNREETQMTTQNPDPQGRRTFTEEVEITGNQLVGTVKDLIEQGNVRRLIIRNPDDRVLLEVPLTIGAGAGVALALFAPPLAAIGALAALVARVKLEIVREEPADKDKNDDLTNRLEG
jgi:hypothetical protein